MRYRGVNNAVNEPLPPEVGQDDLWTNANVVEVDDPLGPPIGRAFELTADKATTTLHEDVPIRVPLTVEAYVKIEGSTANLEGVKFGVEEADGMPSESFLATATTSWTRITGTLTITTGVNTAGVQVDANGWPLSTYGDEDDVVAYNNRAYTKGKSPFDLTDNALSLINEARQSIERTLNWAFRPNPAPQISSEWIEQSDDTEFVDVGYPSVDKVRRLHWQLRRAGSVFLPAFAVGRRRGSVLTSARTSRPPRWTRCTSG